jgi:hypothetical protein
MTCPSSHIATWAVVGVCFGLCVGIAYSWLINRKG